MTSAIPPAKDKVTPDAARVEATSDAELAAEVLRVNAQINAIIRPDTSSAFAPANETPAPDGHGSG